MGETKWTWTEISIGHGTVRFLKAVEILYVGHLRRKRDEIASRSSTSKAMVDAIDQEQEAAHLLYRGVFGFVRNSGHHRLLGPLQPERVLQFVGMVDYLISVAEAAARRELPATKREER